MRILLIFMAAKTSYFSAASASGARILQGVDSRSGWRRRYMNEKRSSSVVLSSVSGTNSSQTSISAVGKPAELVSKFLRWMWNSTLSDDWNMISASGAQTRREQETVSRRS